MRGRGFTLIEVVVVIGIIGILSALLVVGVMAAREQARRSTCLNNLRQLGTALQAHAADKGTLPQGNNPGGYSFLTMVLPYIEQGVIYNSINFSAGSDPTNDPKGSNGTATRVCLRTFLCPADRGAAGNIPWTSYAGNRGRGVQKYGYDGAFPFEANGPIGMSAFRDGTSTTAAIAEWVLGTDLSTRLKPEGNRSTFDTSQQLDAPNELDAFAGACANIDGAKATINLLAKGESWLVGEFSYTLYNHTVGIGGNTCTNGTAVQIGAWTSGSLHAGGANVVFIDGHATFLSDRIDLSLWRAMGSRNGGEILDPSD